MHTARTSLFKDKISLQVDGTRKESMKMHVLSLKLYKIISARLINYEPQARCRNIGNCNIACQKVALPLLQRKVEP